MPLERLSGEAFRARAVASAAEQVAFAEKTLREDLERFAREDAWLKALDASLPPEERHCR